jgi:hypothetical protein
MGMIVENQAFKDVDVSTIDLGENNKNIWYVGTRTQVPIDANGKPFKNRREVRNIPTYAFINNPHFSAIVNRKSPVTGVKVFDIRNVNDLYWTVKNMDAQTFLDNLEDLLPSRGTKSDKLLMAKREVDKLKTFLFGGFKVHIDDIFHVPGVQGLLENDDDPKDDRTILASNDATKKRRTRKPKKDSADENTLNLD